MTLISVSHSYVFLILFLRLFSDAPGIKFEDPGHALEGLEWPEGILGPFASPLPHDLPLFDNTLVTNISAQLGGTAFLHCRVRNANDLRVRRL